MTIEKVPTWEEWIKQRQDRTNESRVRAQAYLDSSTEMNKWLWTWIVDIYIELSMVYKALEWGNNYRNEGETKILQIIKESRKKTDSLIQMILGLDYSATEKDIEERAKILGITVDHLYEETMKKVEDQQKLKEKVFKD